MAAAAMAVPVLMIQMSEQGYRCFVRRVPGDTSTCQS